MIVPMKPPILTPLALAAALAAGCLAAPAASAARCQDVLRYLKADVEDARNRSKNISNRTTNAIVEKGFLMRWARPPTVHFFFTGPEATEMAKTDTDLAVWSINKELPQDFQLRLGPATRSTEFEVGTIKVVYMANRHWPESIPKLKAIASGRGSPSGEYTSSVIRLDHTRLTDAHRRVVVLLHELLHALGRAHVDRDAFPDTIMHPKGTWSVFAAGHLKDLDRAALRAVYSPLVPVGTTTDTLRCDGQGRLRGSR